jgi:2-hydroxycyclohexanecarboxyl-CoA dehydrogenase
VRLQGERVVVTGAGGGIGRATCLALAARGAVVAAADVDEVAAKETAMRCGAGATAHAVDVTDRSALEALRDELGEVGVLVNNAGVGMTGRFADVSAEDWAWIRSVNLDGVVNGCATFGPPMVARGRGHVVNVSSGLGYVATAMESAYCTTKAAVLQLSLCLRADWSPSGVGVTAVCPGIIDTDIVRRTRYLGDREHDRTKVEKAFGKGHKPEQVAAAIVKAIEEDKPLALVGIDAKVGWALHRFAPIGVQQALARRGLG